MKDNKKKVMIVGVLFLVVVAVGAFQLIGSGGSKPVAVHAEVKAPQAAAAPKATDEKVNPFAHSLLPVRDPFQAGTLEATAPATPVLPPPDTKAKPIRQVRGDPANMDMPLPQANKNLNVEPLHPPEAVFAYQLVGVIEGPKPAAVFQDASGGQRLVQAGSSVDGDCRVLSIGNGEVRVQFKDKTLRLKPGGNPSGK